MVNCTEVTTGETDLYSKNVNWFLIPAVIIILFLAFLERRKTYWLTKCDGRPGLVSPMNFIDGYKNRWGLSFVLGALVSLVFTLTRKLIFQGDFPIWAKIFLIYAQCISASVITFPFFACMTTRYRLVGSLTGLLYSASWLGFLLYVNIEVNLCYMYQGFKEKTGLDIVGYGIAEKFMEFLCSFLLVGKFMITMAKCLLKHQYKNGEDEDECLGRHKEYVKQFFTAKCLQEVTKQPTSKERILHYFRKSVPGFTYPTHMFCTTFATIAVLYSVLIQCLSIGDAFSQITNRLGFPEAGDLVTGANVTAIIVSTIVGVYNIYCSVTVYKQDLLRLYKGDKTFIPKIILESSPENHMVRRTKYMGTMIICMIYGMVICYLFLFIPLAFLLIVFRELNVKDKAVELLKQLQWLIYPVSVILLTKLQALLTGRFLLQEKNDQNDKRRPLAINNRKAFQLFSFFNIFISVSIGIFSVLKRLLVALLFGLFLVPRMDRVLCMSGYEEYDKIYMMYVGLLLVDHTHNNPILRVFCSILNEKTTDFSRLNSTVENAIYAVYDQEAIRRTKSIGSSRAKNRWLLAYTLLHNRSLSGLRKHQLPGIVLQMEQESEKKHIIDKVHSKIPENIGTNFAAFFILMVFVFFYLGYSALASSNN